MLRSGTLLAVFLALLIFGPVRTSGQSIGLFSDSTAASCNLQWNTSQTPLLDVYINVLLGDLPNFAMAEFRVAGLPPTIVPPQVEFFHNPGASIGNVEEGINVAYGSCQGEGAPGPVPLGKVTLFSFDPVGEHVLSIQPRLVPTNPNFPCSLIALCNPPLFTLVCVAGGQAF